VIGCREPRRSRYRHAQWDDGTDSRGVSSKNHMSYRLDEMDGGGFVMVVGRLKSWNRRGKRLV
jgi:hypothetical protein